MVVALLFVIQDMLVCPVSHINYKLLVGQALGRYVEMFLVHSSNLEGTIGINAQIIQGLNAVH